MNKHLLVTVLVSVQFLVAGCTPMPTIQTPIIVEPPLPRGIENNSTGLVEIWRTLTGSFRSIPVLSQEQIILNFGPEYGKIQSRKIDGLLTAYQLETGQVSWQSPLENPGFRTYFDLLWHSKRT
jgi:hypothetical protein